MTPANQRVAPKRTVNQWTIYERCVVQGAESTIPVVFGGNPPDGWNHDWDSLFGSTEYDMGDTVDLGLLYRDWNGHVAGSVVLDNQTRDEIGICFPRSPSAIITVKG